MTDDFFMQPPGMHRTTRQTQDGGFTITLCRQELEYDVRYALWKRGQILGAQGESVYLYEIEKDESDWLLRQLSSGVEKLKRKFAWMLAQEKTGDATDALSEAPESWSFRFKPGCRLESSAGSVADAMHAYVVNTVLDEWFKSSDMNVSTAYAAMAETTLASFRTKAPVKRRRPPYLRPDVVIVDDD